MTAIPEGAAVPTTPEPRSFLGACLVRLGYGHDKAEELVQTALDRHAHELAEVIRTEAFRPQKRTESRSGASYRRTRFQQAADCIDPAVTPRPPPPPRLTPTAPRYGGVGGRTGRAGEWGRRDPGAALTEPHKPSRRHPPRPAPRLTTKEPDMPEYLDHTHIAQKLLDQQGEINDLTAKLTAIREWSDQLDDTDRAGLLAILDPTP